MRLTIFQVDAFTDKVFGGNPAAVCPLESWLPTDLMQQIAVENAVAETAFFVRSDQGFEIRWFTPEIEMDLCGHATLAAAHVITRHLDTSLSSIRFQSQSGELIISLKDGLLTLNFPARAPEPCDAPQIILNAFSQKQIILNAFSQKPSEVLKSRDYMLVFETEMMIREMQPDQRILDQINLDPGGVIVTAPGDSAEFVSRFFTPQASIFEDPVTGSAHCSLIPYWSQKLGKSSMIARQLSARGGKLICKNQGDRVLISGAATTYLEGYITV